MAYETSLIRPVMGAQSRVRTWGSDVITVDGHQYGTAAEIAHHLGRGVTPATIRAWARREGLTRHRAGRTAVYRIDEAEQIECDKRYSTRGRPRRLDK
jgi:hypothetical protein